MLKKIGILLLLAGCTNYSELVIPYENGINEVNYTARNPIKTMRVSLRWAKGYCDQKGKDFVVVKREERYKKGMIPEKAAAGMRAGSDIGVVLDHIPGEVAAAGHIAADYLGGETSNRLLFRCIPRE
jgi:hypothetical protein